MLAHSHSATSLYNLSQFKPISDQFTSIVYVVPASNLRTGVVWPRVILPFSHFGFKNILILSCFHVPFYLRYYSEVIYLLFRSYLSIIPKLSFRRYMYASRTYFCICEADIFLFKHILKKRLPQELISSSRGLTPIYAIANVS